VRAEFFGENTFCHMTDATKFTAQFSQSTNYNFIVDRNKNNSVFAHSSFSFPAIVDSGASCNGRIRTKGGWLIGNSTKQDGHRLVYAMCILERLTMNQYFEDKRFASKKPTRMERLTNNAATTFITKRTPHGSACHHASITTAAISYRMWASAVVCVP
jgi:hypothetical protein